MRPRSALPLGEADKWSLIQEGFSKPHKLALSKALGAGRRCQGRDR